LVLRPKQERTAPAEISAGAVLRFWSSHRPRIASGWRTGGVGWTRSGFPVRGWTKPHTRQTSAWSEGTSGRRFTCSACLASSRRLVAALLDPLRGAYAGGRDSAGVGSVVVLAHPPRRCGSWPLTAPPTFSLPQQSRQSVHDDPARGGANHLAWLGRVRMGSGLPCLGAAAAKPPTGQRCWLWGAICCPRAAGRASPRPRA
jgi:hypothetical protein